MMLNWSTLQYRQRRDRLLLCRSYRHQVLRPLLCLTCPRPPCRSYPRPLCRSYRPLCRSYLLLCRSYPRPLCRSYRYQVLHRLLCRSYRHQVLHPLLCRSYRHQVLHPLLCLSCPPKRSVRMFRIHPSSLT